VIVLGTPKQEIKEKVKAFAHAAADVSEKTLLRDGDGLGGQTCVAVDLAPLADQTLTGCWIIRATQTWMK
jgi:hypothetical protein